MPKSYKSKELEIYQGYTLYVTQTLRGWSEINRRLNNSLDKITARDGGITTEVIHYPYDKSPNSHHIVVFINPGWDAVEHINTCAHEATHAALAIAKRIDLGKLICDHDEDSPNEPFPYLVGYITQWLYENTTSSE